MDTFWVNRYMLSAGSRKDLQIDLGKVFESKDIKDIAYINHAPEDAPQGAPEGAPDPALHYKTREEKHEKRNKALINSSESAPVCASSDDAKPPIVMAQAQLKVKRASALASALPSDNGIRNATATPCSSPPLISQPVAQIRTAKPDLATVLRKGIDNPSLRFEAELGWVGDGVFTDLTSGVELTVDQAYQRLLPLLSNPHKEINA